MSELKPLEFLPPKPRYESIAYFHNDKGEEFTVKVSSDDKASVEEYIKNLQAYLEYVSDVSENIEAKNTFIEEAETEVDAETQLKNSLKVVIKATQVLNIEQPKFLNFRFLDSMPEVDDEVDPQVTRITRIYPSEGPKTIIKVKRGKVLAELLKNGKVIKSLEIAAGQKKTFQIPANSPVSDKYSVAITGVANTTSEYEINGNAIV